MLSFYRISIGYFMIMYCCRFISRVVRLITYLFSTLLNCEYLGQVVIEFTPFSFFIFYIMFISVLFICSLTKKKTCIIEIELFQIKWNIIKWIVLIYAYKMVNYFRLRLNQVKFEFIFVAKFILRIQWAFINFYVSSNFLII